MRAGTDGRFECSCCGAVLELARGDEPKIVLKGGSGKQNVRVIKVESREIHRCEIGPYRPGAWP